ncbi:MAG: hypothetical protein AAF743_13750 [Planctomycetota bacterium]
MIGAKPASRWLAAIGLVGVLSGCAVDVSRTEVADPVTRVPLATDLRLGEATAVHLRRDMLGASVNGVLGLDNGKHAEAAVVRGELLAHGEEFVTLRDGERVLHIRRAAIIAIEQLAE